MSVTDFECAIAKSQIGRYISGENLAPEIARQLESHINSCARCKQLLQEKKNSLEAMIVDDGEPIQIESTPIPMSQGTSALKPDYMEELAESARRSLREKLAASPRIKPEVVEVPVVANAFAYKNEVDPETIRLEIPTEKPAKKNRFSLSALALYKNVPDDGAKPAMNMENIRAAKAVIRENNSSMRKPALYLVGLCAVVGAMSFVLRDPTTLFGGKASDKTAKVSGKATQTKKVTKKPTAKYAKVVPHKPIQLNDKGTDAATFVNVPAAKPAPKKVVKVVAPFKTQKPVVAPKVAKVTKPTTPAKVVKKATPTLKAVTQPKKIQAQTFVATSKPKTRHHSVSAKKKATTIVQENTVKLYTPTQDPTPETKEQK